MGCGSSNDKPEWQVMDTAWKGTPKKMDALLTKFKGKVFIHSDYQIKNDLGDTVMGWYIESHTKEGGKPKCDPEMIRVLLKHGADANIGNMEHVDYPVIRTANAGLLEPTRVLIEGGAKLNGLHERIEPPLIQAAARGRTEVVQLMLSKGADVNARNASGQSALDVAQSKGHAATAEVLQKFAASAAVPDESKV